MAAGKNAVKHDPAIEAWAHMRETTDAHFRINARTLRIGAICLVAIPFAMYQLSVAGQGMLAKRDPWTKTAPKAADDEE
ncbi:hypothetical protein H9P43_005609 [Blastocladiella emersonii ATCC 22665]|nr:hypothetical protein H9P43_005609 [Blastocladiella emersonii ATCC 22665]